MYERAYQSIIRVSTHCCLLRQKCSCTFTIRSFSLWPGLKVFKFAFNLSLGKIFSSVFLWSEGSINGFTYLTPKKLFQPLVYQHFYFLQFHIPFSYRIRSSLKKIWRLKSFFISSFPFNFRSTSSFVTFQVKSFGRRKRNLIKITWCGLFWSLSHGTNSHAISCEAI